MRRVLFPLLFLAVTALAAIATLFVLDLNAARQRYAGLARTIDSPFGPIEYAERGSGPPVLGIHGTGGGYDQGLHMLGPVADRGFRLIAPSRLGYLGSSFPAGATPEMQADAFAALLDRLEIDSAAVIGGSAGALSAIQFAIQHPQRCTALILLVPASYAPDRRANESAIITPWQEWLARTMLNSDFLFWAMTKVARPTLTRMLLATEPALIAAAGPAEAARAKAVLAGILPVSARGKGIAMDMATAGAPPPTNLAGIRCPVLAISATDDLFGTALSANHAADNVLDGRAVIYPTGGHLLIGHQSEIMDLIASFILAARAATGKFAGRANR